MTNQENVCCPKFNPEKWDKKEHYWNNKLFIKDSMRTLFHVPLSSTINSKVTAMCKLAEDTKMTESDIESTLLLFRDPSAFRSEIYLSVAGNVPNAENITISGNFISKVYSGPYGAVPKFMKEMNKYLESQNKKALDYYIHYAYCPKCAEKYGDNYMIIFAKV